MEDICKFSNKGYCFLTYGQYIAHLECNGIEGKKNCPLWKEKEE